jgi:hypothetical protein
MATVAVDEEVCVGCGLWTSTRGKGTKGKAIPEAVCVTAVSHVRMSLDVPASFERRASKQRAHQQVVGGW